MRRGALGGAAVATGILSLVATFAVPYRALDDDAHPPVERYLGNLDGGGRLTRVEEPDGTTTWSSTTTRRLPDLLLADVEDVALESVLGRSGVEHDDFAGTGDLPGIAVYRDEVVERSATGPRTHAALTIVDRDGYALVGFLEADGSTQVFDPPLPMLPADPGKGTGWSEEGAFGGARYRYEAEVVSARSREVALTGDERRCLQVRSVLTLDWGGGDPTRQASLELWCEGLGSVAYDTETDAGTRSAEVVAVDGHAPVDAPPPAERGAAAPMDPPALGDEPWTRTAVVSPLGGLVTPRPSTLPTVVEGDPPLLLVATEANPLLQAIQATPQEGSARAWTVALGELAYGAPLVDLAGDRIVVGAAEGQVRAVTTDGLFLWSTDVGDNVATRPLLIGETLVVGSETGDVVGLDPADGSERWRTSTGGPVVSWPAEVDGLVVVGSDDGVVRALDPADGEVVWEHEAAGGVEAAIVPAAGGALVVDRGGWIRLLGQDGSLRWSVELGGTLQTAPTVVGDHLVVAAGAAVALDVATGAERWRLAGDFVGPPASIAGRASVALLDAAGTVEAVDADGRVVERWPALSTPGGDGSAAVGLAAGAGALWVVDAAGHVQRLGPAVAGATDELPLAWVAGVTAPPFDLELLQVTPLVVDGVVHLVDGGGTIVAVDPVTGSAGATGQVAADGLNITVAPAVDGGVGYVVADGRLLAFDLPGGELRWERPLTGMAMRPPQVAGGAVVVALEDGATHRLLVVNASDGEVRWQQTTGTAAAEGALFSPLAVVDGVVVAGDPVSAWSVADGALRWTSTATRALGSSAQLEDGGVAVAVLDDDPEAATGSEIVVLDPATGAERARTHLEGVLVEGLTDLAVADGLVVAQDAGRLRVVGVDPARPSGPVWDVELPARRFGSGALLDDGRLWFALLDGRIVALDPVTGAERSRSAELGIDLADGSFVQQPVRVGDVVVVAAGLVALGVGGAAP
ncbi:MAG: PQQ-binding-like beta-propeller repeat protein [Acidimicrobiia bacterium]